MWNNIGNMEEHRRYLEFLPASSFEVRMVFREFFV